MSRWRRYTLSVVIALVAAVVMSQVGWLLYTGGPYRGQVLDAETRQPLEGAVVLFQWDHRVYGSPGGPTTRFLKAKEVLTDKEGRFGIPWFIGISPNPLSVVLAPLWFAYYPGYASEQIVVTPPTGVPLKDPTVILERRLVTQQERLRAIDVIPGGAPEDAMPNLIQLVNTERSALGLKPVRVRARGTP